MIPFDPELAVETARLRRAAFVASYLVTAVALATRVDRLSELHADLDADVANSVPARRAYVRYRTDICQN